MKADKKTNTLKSKAVKERSTKSKENTSSYDFGGLPDDVDFKKNLGCGG